MFFIEIEIEEKLPELENLTDKKIRKINDRRFHILIITFSEGSICLICLLKTHILY